MRNCDNILTILIGNPRRAKFLIARSRTSAITPSGKLLYPAFQIFNDEQVARGEIGTVTVKSQGLKKDERILIMRALAEYCGTTGASARKYFQQKVCP